MTIEHTGREVTMLLSGDGTYYCCPAVPRDGALWLSVATYPKPIGAEWRYPNHFGVAVMRGRDYVRRFTRMRLRAGRTETLDGNADLVLDWVSAAWWTPGLEEAWDALDTAGAISPSAPLSATARGIR